MRIKNRAGNTVYNNETDHAKAICDEDFRGVDFGGLVLDGFLARDCLFNEANMEDTYFTDTDFSNSDFSKANLRNASFETSNFRNCSFAGADITGTSFYKANLDNTNFVGAIIDNGTRRIVSKAFTVELMTGNGPVYVWLLDVGTHDPEVLMSYNQDNMLSVEKIARKNAGIRGDLVKIYNLAHMFINNNH